MNKAEGEIKLLQSFAHTRIAGVLRAKTTQLKDAVVETIGECWNALIELDQLAGRITIRHEIQSRISLASITKVALIVIGASLIDVHTIVTSLAELNLLESKIDELCLGFSRIILTPRLSLGPDNTLAAISVTADDIEVVGRRPDTDINILFQDLDTVIDYLSTRLPPTIAVPLSERIMPDLVTQLISNWLVPSVPPSLDGMQEFQKVLALVLKLADLVDSVGWRGKVELVDWVQQAPRVWLTKRREVSLNRVRVLLSKGLGKCKKVERIETQRLSAEDKMFQDNGMGDDWNDKWSDDEDQKNINTKSPEKDEEDASAWGLDDNLDSGVTAAEATGVKGDGAVDETEEAWGWGEDENADTSVRPGSTAKHPKKSNGRAQKPAKDSDRDVTLKELYSITALPASVLDIIKQVVSDAETLAQPRYASFVPTAVLTSSELLRSHLQSPIAPAAAGLFSIPTLVLAMYRATAPTYYAVDASGNMYLYNDSMWLAEQLRDFTREQALRTGAKSPRAMGKVKLGPDIDSLEAFAKRAYGKEMSVQRTILGDLLDGAQGFAHCTEPPFASECETAVSSTIDRIRTLHGQWKGVLSQSALLQAIGSLLGTVTHKLIMDIEDMSDISEAESQRLASFCNQISKLEDLFVPDQKGGEAAVPHTAVYTPNWLRFQYLANILESSLVDIKYLWSEGELRLEFTADELIDLIEALFADSEHRRKAIAEIRRSAARH